MAKKATTSSTQVERTLDADELLERLHLHAATVAKDGNIFIEITETFIRFTTNTLVALRQSTLPLVGEGVASALIDYNKFTDIVTNMSGELILGVDEEKRMIFINRDEVFISGLDPDDATVIPKRTINPTIKVADGEAFSQAIARCSYAATSEKEKRPNLEGLSFSCDGVTPVIEIIGANGIVFCFDTTTQIVSTTLHEFKFFVHYSALSTLRLLPKEPIWIAIDDEHGRCWLVSESEQWEMMVRLADYKFPMEKLKSSTPTDGTNIATVNAKVFKKAYALPRIAGQLSTTTTNGKNSFDALLTEILFADGVMTVQTYNGGSSHGAKKTLPYEGVGSGRMIIDQLLDKNIDYLLSKERITFTFRDGNSPYLVTTDSLPGYVTMIMQIQPNDKGKK